MLIAPIFYYNSDVPSASESPKLVHYCTFQVNVLQVLSIFILAWYIPFPWLEIVEIGIDYGILLFTRDFDVNAIISSHELPSKS